MTQQRRCHFKLFVLVSRLKRDSIPFRETVKPPPLPQPPEAGNEAVPPRTLAIRSAFPVRVSAARFPESRSDVGKEDSRADA